MEITRLTKMQVCSRSRRPNKTEQEGERRNREREKERRMWRERRKTKQINRIITRPECDWSIGRGQ